MLPEKPDRSSFNKIWTLAFLMIGLFFGVASCWKIFEGDVFWLCRAGEEIVNQHSVQRMDTWSSTAQGHPWYNFQWLSAIVFFWVSRIQPIYHYLPLLRAALITVIFLILLFMIRLRTLDPKKLGYSVAILIPAFYLINFGRLELRPDIFGILIFSLVLLTVLRAKGSFTFSIQILLLILWANFHGGTFPIGLCVLVLSWLNERHSLVKIMVGSFCWFLTPIHFHVLESVKSITHDYDWTLILNADHAPFTLELLNPARFQATFILWVILSISVLVVALKSSERKFWLLALLALDLLTLGRVRARPYSTILAMPLLVPVIESYAGSQRGRMLLAAISLGVCVVLLPLHFRFSPPLGMGLNAAEFPIQTVAILNAIQPHGRLLNHYNFGGYVIDQARGYPVAQDGRETIFADFFKQKTLAEQSPESFAHFLSENRFDILLTIAPKPGEEAQRLPWYPLQQWARVASDQASVLYLRRTPENQKMIETLEQSSKQ